MKTFTHYLRFLLFTVFLMAVAFPGYGQYSDEFKILPADGAADDRFGLAVTIDGEYAIVGAFGDDDYGSSSGSAYIFRRNAGGDWVLIKKLTASDAASGDFFGRSVAMNGNYAIVGANGDDDNVSNSGSAYIFNRNQGGSDNWGQVAKLTASDGAEYDQFGYSVAISGDDAIVGAYGDDDNGHDSGSAYIFSRNQGGSDQWGQVTRLTTSDGIADQWFGYSVAISGGYAIVGAQGDDDNGSLSGSAYIFSRNQGGSDHWGQLTKLTASDGSAQESFGCSVAIYDDYAIVGAKGDDDNGASSGSAYIFNRNQGGSDHWGQVTKLTAGDGAANDQFGFSVALSDDYAIVGAYLDDDNGLGSGSAYIFSRNQGGSDHWGQVTKLTAGDGAGEDDFGFSVAICGDYAIVGAPFNDDNGSYSGSAYVFGPAPEMDVQGGSPRVSIANGDDTPWNGDGTYFGGTNVGDSKAGTFFIYNTGSANLNLTATPAMQFTGPHAADFYLSTIYNTTIAPGGNTEFVIVFTPSAPGERNATVVIPNNDQDENPYEFAIGGLGKAPEMNVEHTLHYGVIIADGDMTPSESDGTDIGSANVGDIKTVRFTIFNEGDATLYLTARPEVQISGANASDFAFTDISKNEIEGYGHASWFSIQFNPSAPGLRSAIISIPNNDPDENPYDFAIQGTGIAVGDNEPPVIVPKPDPISLWPPNHKYQTITVAQCLASVSDNCANLSIDDVHISQVSSDEPENAQGGGDGNTKNDIVIATDCKSVQLRSERNGSGNGRVYTIHFSVADEAGNVGTATYLVTVPHSRNGDPAVDDGPAYTVIGCGCGLPKLVGNGDDRSNPADAQTSLPEGYALEQNYPNPFNPETQIRFSIPQASAVTLQIFNSAGQLVRTLVSGEKTAGYHQVTWNATDDSGRRVASGVYIYLLRAGAFRAQNKLVLMK